MRGLTSRFFDALNTPMAVLAAAIVVVAVNSFLYFGYYRPATTITATEPTSPPPERTERTHPMTTTVERTRNTTTFEGETTSTATSTATAAP